MKEELVAWVKTLVSAAVYAVLTSRERLGGALSVLSIGIKLTAGSLASWQDSGGGRWILGAGSGAITALKVAEAGGAPNLQAGWTSRDIASPVSPVIVNGVVFTASTGSANSMLYALDAASGKELWNSGKAIAGAIRGGGISIGNSQVYLATSDGTFYAFGFPMEH